MDSNQLLERIIMPALAALGDKYASDSAAILLLATAAQESHCVEYVRQVGGPARGYLQMEPHTLHDLYANYLQYHPGVMVQIGREDAARLVYDLRYATWTARLQYYRHPDALPESHDRAGMYDLYKRLWNTPAGAATSEQFADNWQRYVVSVL